MVKTHWKTGKLIDNPTLHVYVPAMCVFAAGNKILIFSLVFKGMITNPKDINNQYCYLLC